MHSNLIQKTAQKVVRKGGAYGNNIIFKIWTSKSKTKNNKGVKEFLNVFGGTFDMLLKSGITFLLIWDKTKDENWTIERR